MEGTNSDTGKLAVQAGRPTSGDVDVEGATIPSPARRAPSHDGAAAHNNKALDEPAAAGDEVDDDEQMERFYALLANIRAMRAVFRTMATTTGKRKRLRGSSEPPWRPAFRMEDFEADATTATSRWATRKTERSQPDHKEEKEDDPALASLPRKDERARRFDNNSKSI